MKNKTKLMISGSLAAVLLAALGVRAATAGAPMDTNSVSAPATEMADTNASASAAMASLFGDPVVAKGKGFDIKQSRLDEVAAAVKANAAARGQQVTDDDVTKVEAMALNEFIGTALLLEKSTDADRTQGQKQADAAIDDLVKQVGSQEALELRLKGAGKTLAQYRSELADSMTANAALVRILNVSVTDADIKKYYNDNPTEFEQPEQVHVRHILFATLDLTTQQPLSDDLKQAKLKQAQDVLKRVRAGEDFATLAKQYSDDPGSKENGGELLPFSHGEMVPEFDSAAFSLTNNQISDIVTSQFGYHIIQMIGKTPEQKIDLTKVSDQIKSYLLRQKLAPIAPPYLQKLKADGSVQILDDNLKTAVAALDASATNAPPASAPTP
ncbi:MAG TPA: peptidylprolyl isomerase [Verrucomicrobiae bacterium]|jgi:parvulin-like peptidyl-prolyl isomerase